MIYSARRSVHIIYYADDLRNDCIGDDILYRSLRAIYRSARRIRSAAASFRRFVRRPARRGHLGTCRTTVAQLTRYAPRRSHSSYCHPDEREAAPRMTRRARGQSNAHYYCRRILCVCIYTGYLVHGAGLLPSGGSGERYINAVLHRVAYILYSTPLCIHYNTAGSSSSSRARSNRCRCR